MANIQIPIDFNGQPVVLCDVGSNWTTVLVPGVVHVADSGALLKTPQSISDIATRLFDQPEGYGRVIIARVASLNSLTITTDAVLYLYGRKGSDAWQLLENRAGAIAATMVTAATDVDDATNDYTTVNITSNTWDTQGCDVFFFGVQTKNDSGGDDSDAFVQCKFIQ